LECILGQSEQPSDDLSTPKSAVLYSCSATFFIFMFFFLCLLWRITHQIKKNCVISTMFGGRDAVPAVFIHLAKLTPLGCIRAVFGNTRILAQILGCLAGSTQSKHPKNRIGLGGSEYLYNSHTSTSIWVPNGL